ncbi:hypothetical protein QR680_006277 [Steinernema hermaphroditum]|uniref:TIL domain-containing protein n=1 Tax=Steinernema hermaphroditum TaxID=289476 RepID=A0AA39HV04_9BILA|nr:hypothetical protein QR680_006277 [Steinernema hermaphroditum]
MYTILILVLALIGALQADGISSGIGIGNGAGPPSGSGEGQIPPSGIDIGGGAGIGSGARPPGSAQPPKIGSGVEFGSGGGISPGGGIQIGDGIDFGGFPPLPPIGTGVEPGPIPEGPIPAKPLPNITYPGFCRRENEVFSLCNGRCDRTCTNYYPKCSGFCISGCICKDQYVRDCYGNCVPYWTCYNYDQPGSSCCPSCNWNEVCRQPNPRGRTTCTPWWGGK